MSGRVASVGEENKTLTGSYFLSRVQSAYNGVAHYL